MHRHAVNTHANAHSQSVFPFALALMDKIRGWEERKKVGSLCAASLWIYTEAVLCNGRHQPEEDLQWRLLAIMESANWVREDAFNEEHEWVTQDIILECLVRIPCVIQWALLWFFAPNGQIGTSRSMGCTLRFLM